MGVNSRALLNQAQIIASETEPWADALSRTLPFMPRQGRALEQLVAELERVLGPTNVVIQSPEYIVGRKTGERREVDVTLRTRIGSSDLLVMIECRDRQRRQDVTWIEQVISKQEDVGANKAVAVCRAGFTPAAQRLARAKGIDLRTIASVTGQEVFAWLGLKTVTYRNWNMEYQRLRFGFEPGSRPALEPEMSAGLSSNQPGLVPLLVRRGDGKAMSVHDVWNTIRKEEVFPDLEPNKQYDVTLSIGLRGDPPPYQMKTVDGLVDLVCLEVGGLLDYQETDVPISRLYEYADESGSLVQTAEVEVVYREARLVFGFNTTPDKTRHSVTVRRDNDPGPDVIHIQTSGIYEVVIDEEPERSVTS